MTLNLDRIAKLRFAVFNGSDDPWRGPVNIAAFVIAGYQHDAALLMNKYGRHFFSDSELAGKLLGLTEGQRVAMFTPGQGQPALSIPVDRFRFYRFLNRVLLTQAVKVEWWLDDLPMGTEIPPYM